MGDVKANAQRGVHARAAGEVVGDRKIRFHFGVKNIDKTYTAPSWWDATLTAARGSSQSAWDAQVAVVRAAVIGDFDWDDYPDDWADALRIAFKS